MESTLGLLCFLKVNSFILELTGIEATIREQVYSMKKVFRPICGYILRKWERERTYSFTTRLPKTAYLPEPTKVEWDRSEEIFKNMKKNHLIQWNKPKGSKQVKSLRDICSDRIKSALCDAAKEKAIIPLFPLVKKVSSDTMERIEANIPAIAEISDKLWQTMLFSHFRGHHMLSSDLSYKVVYLLLEKKYLQLKEAEELRNSCLLRRTQLALQKINLSKVVLYISSAFGQ